MNRVLDGLRIILALAVWMVVALVVFGLFFSDDGGRGIDGCAASPELCEPPICITDGGRAMTDTATVALVDWLLACIAEDEAGAQAALMMSPSTDPWWVDGPAQQSGKWWVYATGSKFDRELADHIARWDPARVLTECEAKRRIIAAAEQLAEYCDATREHDAYRYDAVLPRLLVPIATPYADRPGYRAEWRP